MKNEKRTPLIIGSGLAFVVALAIGSAAQAQTTGAGHDKMTMDGKSKAMDHKMMAGCEEMMKQKQAMKDDMKAQDAELTAHVARMNAAAPDKKAGLTAEVVTHSLSNGSPWITFAKLIPKSAALNPSASLSPCSVSAMSVRPVCCPLSVQAVSPCRTRQTMGKAPLTRATSSCGFPACLRRTCGYGVGAPQVWRR